MTISVIQLSNYLKSVLEIDGYLNDLSVAGEITNVKQYKNGWFFTLKEGDCAVNCSYFSNQTIPVAGMMAVVEGSVSFYQKTGSLSIYVRRLTATNNTGEAYLQFLALKEKLQKEGLFDESRKKEVPHCCKNIGVVTSKTGAVIHDITNVALRRQPFCNIILYPVKVQGEGADYEIAQGVLYFSDKDVDAVIVGRGGGSNEDLSAFNSEVVVRAIDACSKPVVSAVGHGVDFTLCDFVADKRAVTPSEAAEYVTIDVVDEKRRVAYLLNIIQSECQRKLEDCKQEVHNNVKRVGLQIGHKINFQTQQIKHVLVDIEKSIKLKYQVLSQKLDSKIEKLSALNPQKLLQRGYSYVSTNNKPLTSIKQVEIGNDIKVETTDGVLNAVVSGKETK